MTTLRSGSTHVVRVLPSVTRRNVWSLALALIGTGAPLATGQAGAAPEQPRGSTPVASASETEGPGRALDVDGFVMAGPGRGLTLPADHGSHPETRTEWWYFTGHLTDEAGGRYGFQATWFRRALAATPPARSSPLGVRDVLMFHGALTDLTRGELAFSESSSRSFPPWARAETERLAVAVFEDEVVTAADVSTLRFTAGAARLELSLDLEASPVMRHGIEPGLSVKGHEPGQASWYYSLPSIPVSGRLIQPDGLTLTVSGQAWMDHEFGSSQLGAAQVGWDWFSVALDDGAALMAYQLRRADGSADSTSSASLALVDGSIDHVSSDGLVVRALDTWTSPDTGIVYPSGWELRLPDHELTLRVTPLLRDQELVTTATGVTYWEGLCRFEGERRGAPVRGEGYVELVGYGEPISSRFTSSGR